MAADLCEFDNRVLLVVSDYYSNYIEVARLNNLTSRAVIKELKAIFARFGVPDTLVTDNGAQFLLCRVCSLRNHVDVRAQRHRRQPTLSQMERQRRQYRP